LLYDGTHVLTGLLLCVWLRLTTNEYDDDDDATGTPHVTHGKIRPCINGVCAPTKRELNWTEICGCSSVQFCLFIQSLRNELLGHLAGHVVLF